MKNVFSFSGRMARLNFLLVFLVSSIFMAIARMATDPSSITGGIFVFIIWVFLTWILVCSGVQRFHDLNKPGRYAWLLLIPLAPIYVACLKGTVGPNEYGEDPLGVVTGTENQTRQRDADIRTNRGNTGRNIVSADDNWQAEMNFIKVLLPILAVLGIIAYLWVRS